MSKSNSEVIVISDTTPSASASPYGGSVDGDEIVVWFDDETGTWSGCFTGVSDGLYYESDDYAGFQTKDDAIDTLRYYAAQMSDSDEF